jgi:hypothetical protein
VTSRISVRSLTASAKNETVACPLGHVVVVSVIVATSLVGGDRAPGRESGAGAFHFRVP